jgi:membrane protein implicated in regulation of membrane protease activity
MNMATIWLISAILLIVSEFVIPGFVIIFFGVGALAASAVAFFTDASLAAQGWVFVIASVLSLVLGRRFFKTALHGKLELSHGDADDDGIVGSVVVVTAAINPPQPGRVEVHGADWKAVANRPIAAGESVKVISRDNITLTVE